MWPPLKLLWSRRAFEVGAPSALAEYLHLQQTGPGAQPASSALSCGCGDPGEGTTPEGPSGLSGDSDDGDRAGRGCVRVPSPERVAAIRKVELESTTGPRQTRISGSQPGRRPSASSMGRLRTAKSRT